MRRTNLTRLAEDITTTASRLDPATMLSKISEWTRGSLPSGTLAGGSRGASDGSPMLQFDADDRQWRQLLRRYSAALVEVAKHLEVARQIERIVVPPDPADKIEYGLWRSEQSRKAVLEKGTAATECKNCKRAVECTTADPIRSGRCSACAQFFWRNQKERPLPDMHNL